MLETSKLYTVSNITEPGQNYQKLELLIKLESEVVKHQTCTEGQSSEVYKMLELSKGQISRLSNWVER